MTEARTAASTNNKVNDDELEEMQDAGEDEELCSGKPCSPRHFLNICEQLLSFHAWYKCGAPHSKSILDTPSDGNEQSTVLGDAVRTMIETATTRLPRKQGNGWNLQKVHEMFHLDYFMDQFGSPLNWDASTGERNLKEKAKKHAATAQNRGDGEHLRQIAMREHETCVRKKAMRHLELNTHYNVKNAPNGEEGLAGGVGRQVAACGNVKYTLTPKYDSEMGNQLIAEWISKRQVRGEREVHPVVIHYFQHHMQTTRYPPGSTVECYTKVNIGDTSYRCHPNYNSQGPWYDWTMIQFDTEGNPPADTQHRQKRRRANHCSNEESDEEGEGNCFDPSWYPSKIVCLFRDPLTNDTEDNLFALVQSCEESNHELDSVLYQRWEKEYTVDNRLTCTHKRHKGEGSVRRPTIRKVPLEALACPVFVVEDTPGLHEVFYDDRDFAGITVVKPRATNWPKHFL